MAEEEPHQIQRWQASFQIRQLREWMLNPSRRKMPFLVSWAVVQALLVDFHFRIHRTSFQS
jgi:hypothetical protein